MVQATIHDLPSIVSLLATAFADNKSVNRCVKQDAKRIRRIEHQITYIARISLKNQMAFVDNRGAMLCNLSTGKKANLFDDIYYLLYVSGIKLGLELMKRERYLKQILPKEPHCHLWFIGVDVAFQGKGHGSSMIAFLKKICTEMQLPIYLETSNPLNLKFYEKNGFTLYHECQLPTDNFKLYFYCWKPPA